MLIVNDKPLNLNDTKDPHVQEVLQGFEQLRKLKFPLIFRDRFGIRINPTGEKEPGKTSAFSLLASCTSENGRDYWRYTKTPPKDGKFRKSRILFHDSLAVRKSDLELAFFLVYKSDAVKTGQIKLVNKEAEATKQREAKQKMISTRYILYDEDSPLYDQEDTIRLIALSFGIAKADNKNEYTLDQIKLALEKVIEKAEMTGDRERNENAFKAALDVDGVVKMKGVVQNAIDAGIIDFQEPYWIMLDGNGKKSAQLCTVPSTEFDRRYEILIDYLKRNVVNREAIEQALNKEGAFNESSELTNEMIDEMKFVQKLAWAKKYNFKKFGAKDEEVTAFLRTKVKS